MSAVRACCERARRCCRHELRTTSPSKPRGCASASATRRRWTASTSPRPGHGARRARPQRRRQDHRRPHPRHAAAAPTRARRSSPATTSPASPPACASRSASPASTRPSTSCSPARQNLVLIGALLDLSRKRRQGARARAARLVRPHRRRRPPRQTYSGGMRRRLDLAASLVGRPGDRLPRRADDRPGPGQARGHVGRRAHPRRRRLDRPADHAVPRGGRRARRRDHGHRPRPRDRPRHARRPQAHRRRPDADRPPGRPDPPRRGRARSSPSSPARAPSRPARGTVSRPGHRRRGARARPSTGSTDAGIAVTELSLPLPSLDEVFFSLTGRHDDGHREPEEVLA